MKKNLLLLSLLLAFSIVFAQQNKPSQISSSPANTRVETRSSQRTNGTQPAPTSTTSSCMSINYPTVTTWSPTIYSTGTAGAGGFVSGPNQYLDKEKAMYFDASASAFTKLYQVDVWFAKGYSSNPSKVVNMKIYDGTSGTPSTSVIATASLTMGTIMGDVAGNFNTSFYFPAGVTLPASKRFFCSVDISNLNWATSKDSLCIVSNQSGQTTPAAAWERQTDNLWYQYSAAAAWTQSVSLYIHPFLRNTPVTATFTATGPALCAGNSITYDATGSTTGGVTYWGFGASTSPTTASTNSISVLYPTAGTYTTTLLILDACDALGASQATFVVNAKPTVAATPSSTTICNGTNITLSGSGASTYTWTGGVTNGVAFAPSTSLNYTVSATAANGCTNSAVANVSVNPIPTVLANTNSSAVCMGNNVTLSGGGATTYTWSSGVLNAVAFSPSSTNSYTVTGSLNNCTNTAVVSVTVNNIPTVTANTTSSAVCMGSNVTLSGGGATSYTWSSGVSNAVAFAPLSTNSYTVTGSANNCTNTAVVSVTVNNLPTVSANSTSTAVCVGSNVTLSGGGASTYTWSGSVSNGIAFAPAFTNTYSVNGTDVNGCMNTATVGVTVNNLPTVMANSTSTAVCAGSNVTLTGGGASTYTWSGSVSDGVAFAPASTNTYSVNGTDLNGCSNTATVGVTVNNLPTVTANSTSTLVCVGDNITLNGGGASTYTWTGGVSDNTPFIASASDSYTVTGADVNGCSSPATVSVTVNLCTGIQSLTVLNSISVFPNPNNGDFTIQSQKADGINVINELGQVIETIKLNEENNFSFNVRGLSSGIYFLVGKTVKQKVIVTK
jgi:hypothetical protein